MDADVCGCWPAPTAEPTSAPTATPTPVPAAEWWSGFALRYFNGFAGCNPEAGPGRTRCHGDTTPWYTMPGYGLVPKGEGCEALANPAACRANDTPGTPCGGAPSCDMDHMLCRRVAVGCGGREVGDPRGPLITWSGIDCAVQGNGYSFDCTGEPGAVYWIRSDPRPDVHDADGRPIPVQGSGSSLRAGMF